MKIVHQKGEEAVEVNPADIKGRLIGSSTIKIYGNDKSLELTILLDEARVVGAYTEKIGDEINDFGRFAEEVVMHLKDVPEDVDAENLESQIIVGLKIIEAEARANT